MLSQIQRCFSPVFRLFPLTILTLPLLLTTVLLFSKLSLQSPLKHCRRIKHVRPVIVIETRQSIFLEHYLLPMISNTSQSCCVHYDSFHFRF